jgi:hypothetical protein
MLAAQAAARAPADGYTVLITTNTTHAANEHLYKKLAYDPVKDFVPVTGLGKGGRCSSSTRLAVQVGRRHRRGGEEEPRQAELRQRQLVEPGRRRDVQAAFGHRHPARAVQEQPERDHRLCSAARSI